MEIAGNTVNDVFDVLFFFQIKGSVSKILTTRCQEIAVKLILFFFLPSQFKRKILAMVSAVCTFLCYCPDFSQETRLQVRQKRMTYIHT